MCYVTEHSGEGFLTKRIIRIVPIYWSGTIGVFGIALIAPGLLQNTTSNVVDLVKSLVFIPFKKGETVTPVLFLGWSLNYEMFFYLLFALSMKANHRYRAIICSALIVAIVIYGQLMPSKSIPIKFWTNPNILEFVFGMLCFSFFRKAAKQRAQQSFDSSSILWALTSGILILCMPLVSMVKLSEVRVLDIGILATLTLYAALMGLSGVRFPKVMVLMGDASYSLYLFHPYIIQGFVKILHAFDTANSYGYFVASVVIFLCCGLSVLSYKFVERPITHRLRAKFIGKESMRTQCKLNQGQRNCEKRRSPGRRKRRSLRATKTAGSHAHKSSTTFPGNVSSPTNLLTRARYNYRCPQSFVLFRLSHTTGYTWRGRAPRGSGSSLFKTVRPPAVPRAREAADLKTGQYRFRSGRRTNPPIPRN